MHACDAEISRKRNDLNGAMAFTEHKKKGPELRDFAAGKKSPRFVRTQERATEINERRYIKSGDKHVNM